MDIWVVPQIMTDMLIKYVVLVNLVGLSTPAL
jgi:hypothetical protein